MSKYYTTIEQSKKLLEIGIAPTSADMFFTKYSELPWTNSPNRALNEIEEIPCWSVGALLEAIYKYGRDRGMFDINLSMQANGFRCNIAAKRHFYVYVDEDPISAIGLLFFEWYNENKE